MRARVRLLNPEATATVVSDENLTTLLNEAALDFAYKTNCLHSRADSDVVAATKEYALPTDCLKVLSVYYGGTGSWEKLAEVTTDHMSNEIDESWYDNTGTIYAYYKRGNTIGLYNTPTSAEAGTSYLRVYYLEKPTAMSVTTDDPLNDNDKLEPYHNLLVSYTRSMCKEIIGKFAQGQALKQEYLMGAAEAKLELEKLNDFQQVIRPYYKGSSGYSLKQNPLDQ